MTELISRRQFTKIVSGAGVAGTALLNAMCAEVEQEGALSEESVKAFLAFTDQKFEKREAKTFHPPPRVGLAYTEPLIHARIREICEALKRRGLYVSITTNGYLLPRLAGDLVEIGVDFLTVSVDGSRLVTSQV